MSQRKPLPRPGSGMAARLLSVALAMLPVLSLPALAKQQRPVSTVTIYPGDIIRDQMLVDSDFPDAIANGVFANDRSQLVGKAAKRTLLPGNPIPLNAVGIPKIVTIGAMVRLVFEEDGLEISTYATALQSGAAGDVISVRNMDSGVTLSGVIRPDGSIRVGPG